MYKLKILIADDMKHVRLLTESQLSSQLSEFCETEIVSVETGEDAVKIFTETPNFDIVLLDVDFSQSAKSLGMNGLEASKQIQILNTAVHTVIISSHEEPDLMEQATTEFGVDWYIRRSSISFDELSWLCKIALVGRLHREGCLTDERYQIFSKSLKMRQFLKMVDRVLPQLNVLIQGETGTGKELIAHRLSANARFLCQQPNRPFIIRDCGALSASLIESELFGHSKGAFTGAYGDKIGLLEQANGGDLFLDEIHNIPLDVQAKLLRALNDGTFQPVGGKKTIRSTFRIIAATNMNLMDAKSQGRLLPDFVARIAFKSLTVPALRERREDIPVLVKLFLDRNSRFDKEFTTEALEYLSDLEWKENIRELRSLVETVITEISIPVISATALRPFCVENVPAAVSPLVKPSEALFINGLKAFMRDQIRSGTHRAIISNLVDKVYLEESMGRFKSISEMADRIGYSRPTLRKKLQEYGLYEDFVG